MNLKDIDTLELKDRYDWLIREYVSLATELAPKLEKFGRHRKELQLIVVELNRRGSAIEDPEDLKHIVEEETKIRNPEIGGEQKTDKTA